MKSKNKRSLKCKEVFKECGDDDLSTKVAIVQTLLPEGLRAFYEMMKKEVDEIVGPKSVPVFHGRYRWGNSPGWVHLGDQKVHVRVQRVRDVNAKREIKLRSYEHYQEPRIVNDQVLMKVLLGLSQRRYMDAAMKIPETFGIAPSSVSRRFIRASAKRLEQLENRDLSGYDIVAIVMDGKYFGEADMIVAVGVTIEGEKVILGFVEGGSENHTLIGNFLQKLKDRGLQTDKEILFVTDGSSGMIKGIEKVFGKDVNMQRCQFHKTENVMSYLPKKHQGEVRRKLNRAYAGEDYDEAKKRLDVLVKELKLINKHAANSLLEGLEETLTLHRLGVNIELGKSFRTTNMIESVFSQVGQFTDRVDCWKNSSQRQRWLAASLLEIEKRINRVQGHRNLPLLRQAMKRQSPQMQKLAA